MRKHTMAMGVALALSLGGAGIAAAQSTTPIDRPQAEQHDRGPGGRRGGPERMLLKGVTLSSAQKAKLEEMRKADRDQMEKHRGDMRGSFDQIRAARERGDTATARSLMEKARSQMEQRREQHFTAIRSVLTADQQRQFDANVAEWKQHARDRQARWRAGQGGRGGHQHSDAKSNGK